MVNEQGQWEHWSNKVSGKEKSVNCSLSHFLKSLYIWSGFTNNVSLLLYPGSRIHIPKRPGP